MIDEEAVRSILLQYEKFGWQLDRVLLSPEFRTALGSAIIDLFGAAEVSASDLDAAWFSRPAKNGRVALELRLLAAYPFALVDSVEPDASNAELESAFDRTEQAMREHLAKPTKTH